MSSEEIDDSDRDPRRVRFPLQENEIDSGNVNYEIQCYRDCSHSDRAVVRRPVRYPLNRFDKPRDGGDEIQVKNGSSFVRREGKEGTVRPESYNSQLLRLTDRSGRLNARGSYQNDFKGYGWNRRHEARKREKTHQERSNFTPYPNVNPFRFPNPNFTQNVFGSRFVTPNKNLRNTLLRHPLEWTPTEPLDGSLKLHKITNPVLRDGEYFDRMDHYGRDRTITSSSLEVNFEKNHSRWEPRSFKRQAVYPELWYARHCAEKDRDHFAVKVKSRQPSPQTRMTTALISRSVRPRIEVTGWRRKVKERGNFILKIFWFGF